VWDAFDDTAFHFEVDPADNEFGGVAMTFLLELDPETEALYAAEAARRGVDPAAVVREVVRRHRPETPVEPNPLTVVEFHKMLDELAVDAEKLPSLPTSAFSRESIYEDHP